MLWRDVGEQNVVKTANVHKDFDNCIPKKEDAFLVVSFYECPDYVSRGIDRDAMRFQGLDAILDWLAGNK